MKIMICGKNKICIDVFQYLLKKHKKENLVGVYVESDNRNTEVFGNFKRFLIDNDIQHFSVNKKDDFYSLIQDCKPLMIYSIQFSMIIEKRIIEEYKGKIINLHFSYLPAYRGVSPISNAIRNGEKYFGVTFHIIDEGIDTGPIIAQKKFNIENLKNIEVYKLCEKAGFYLIKKIHLKILLNIKKYNTAFKISKKQHNELSNYFSRNSFNYENTFLNFNQTSHQVYQSYLSYTFPPILYPKIKFKNKVYKIIALNVDYKNICYNAEKPGEIFSVDDDNLLVSTQDCWISLMVEYNE